MENITGRVSRLPFFCSPKSPWHQITPWSTSEHYTRVAFMFTKTDLAHRPIPTHRQDDSTVARIAAAQLIPTSPGKDGREASRAPPKRAAGGPEKPLCGCKGQVPVDRVARETWLGNAASLNEGCSLELTAW